MLKWRKKGRALEEERIKGEPEGRCKGWGRAVGWGRGGGWGGGGAWGGVGGAGRGGAGEGEGPGAGEEVGEGEGAVAGTETKPSQWQATGTLPEVLLSTGKTMWVLAHRPSGKLCPLLFGGGLREGTQEEGSA